jgi:hypothetical protein
METERLKKHAEERIQFCKTNIEGFLNHDRLDKIRVYLFLDSLDIWKEVKIEIGRFESETENAEEKQQILKYLKNLVKTPLNEAISFMERQKEGISDEWKSKIDADIQKINLIREDLQLDIEK